MKKVHFVSGLPRSCSTLLCNLLAQNPRVHSTGSSPLHEIGYVARNVFKTEEVKSMQPLDAEKMYLDYVKGGILNAFESLTERPVVVDKNRSWVGHLDQLFKIFPDAKVLVPIRDLRGIFSSMEKKFRKHPSPMNTIESQSPPAWTTIERRIQGWASSPPIGIAIERLHEAASRFKNRLYFVRAEDLTNNPKATMEKIWNYLEEEPFKHDFNNVEQYTIEHDVGWPYGDHIIKNKIEPLVEDWDQILGNKISETIYQKFKWVKDL